MEPACGHSDLDRTERTAIFSPTPLPLIQLRFQGDNTFPTVQLLDRGASCWPRSHRWGSLRFYDRWNICWGQGNCWTLITFLDMAAFVEKDLWFLLEKKKEREKGDVGGGSWRCGQIVVNIVLWRYQTYCVSKEAKENIWWSHRKKNQVRFFQNKCKISLCLCLNRLN